ncbi:MAG: hypothetical protein RIS73_204, partial [Bacteroidota bacterium]
MKNIYFHIFLLLALTGLFTACNQQKEGIPPLNETFSRKDKNPFGTFIAYRQMENMFNKNSIKDKKQAFNKTWNDISDTASLYVCIAPALYVNDDEVKAMLDYVYAGNSLFIAANFIDETLLKEIKCTEEVEPIMRYNFFDSLRTTNTLFSDTAFSYYYQPFKNSLTYKDAVFTKAIGVNENGKTNYIVYFHGKGKLF